MNEAAKPTAKKLFANTFWLKSSIPIADLHDHRILLRLHDGPFVREGVFRLDARANGHFPDIHVIHAFHDAWHGYSGTTTVITFDQRRANAIRHAPSGAADYGYVADFDLAQPLDRVPDLDERVERHLEETWAAIPVQINDPNA